GNMISSIGAAFMAVAVLIMLYNIVVTSVKGEYVSADPWGDGRTLEWAVASPPAEYNFKQLPLVRGLDALWVEKMQGKKEMTPAEPLGDIHMPNSSILPLIISFGLFVAAFGFLYHPDGVSWSVPVMIIGGIITFGSMTLRSIIDDHGYHIHKEDLMDDDDKKGVEA